MQANTIKKIYVKSLDHGFWTEQSISVKRYEQVDEDEFEVVFCNHDGAEEIEEEQEYINPNGSDVVWKVRVLICGCGAWRLVGTNDWENTPMEGKHYE